jgi:hypothetical protein
VAETGSTALSELRDQLAAASGDAWVRAVLKADADGSWTIEHVEATVGAEPERWDPAVWEYGRLVFVAARCQARDLATLCVGEDSASGGGDGTGTDDDSQASETGKDSGDQGADEDAGGAEAASAPKPMLRLGRFEAAVPRVWDSVHWEHRPSRAQHDPTPMPWPTVDYQLSERDRSASVMPPESGFLIGDGCPSFPTFANAYRAFFHGNFAGAGAQNPFQYGLIRVAQPYAWIKHVRVGPTFAEVRVAGSQPIGACVELNSATDRVAKPVGSSKLVRLRLPHGLADDTWLYLTRQGRWLDYRVLGSQLHGSRNLKLQGVEIVVPDEPAAELEALIYQGEGSRLEFKVKLPESDSEKRNVLKTVVAFANTDGGTIVCGVDSDETTITGLEVVDTRQVRDGLINLIRNGLTEFPPVSGPTEHVVDGKRLLVFTVDPGTGVPYAMTFQRGGRAEYFVRRGASNFPARPEEIRQLVLDRLGRADAASGFHGPFGGFRKLSTWMRHQRQGIIGQPPVCQAG